VGIPGGIYTRGYPRCGIYTRVYPMCGIYTRVCTGYATPVCVPGMLHPWVLRGIELPTTVGPERYRTPCTGFKAGYEPFFPKVLKVVNVVVPSFTPFLCSLSARFTPFWAETTRYMGPASRIETPRTGETAETVRITEIKDRKRPLPGAIPGVLGGWWDSWLSRPKCVKSGEKTPPGPSHQH